MNLLDYKLCTSAVTDDLKLAVLLAERRAGCSEAAQVHLGWLFGEFRVNFAQLTAILHADAVLDDLGDLVGGWC